MVINEQKTWTEGQDFCKSIGSNLATVTTKGQLEMVVSVNEVYSITKAWIGLNDRDSEGNFSWIDGSSCDYTNTGLCIDDPHFAKGEPHPYGVSENCVQLNTFLEGGSFNDVDCNNRLSFLCNLASNVSLFHISEYVSTSPSVEDEYISNKGFYMEERYLIIGAIVCGSLCILGIVGCGCCGRKICKQSDELKELRAREIPSISSGPSKTTSSDDETTEFSHKSSGSANEVITIDHGTITDDDRDVMLKSDGGNELLNGEVELNEISIPMDL